MLAGMVIAQPEACMCVLWEARCGGRLGVAGTKYLGSQENPLIQDDGGSKQIAGGEHGE